MTKKDKKVHLEHCSKCEGLGYIAELGALGLVCGNCNGKGVIVIEDKYKKTGILF